MRQLEIRASQLDTDHPDSASTRELNELIWKSVKGASSQMPAPVHSGSAPASDRDDE